MGRNKKSDFEFFNLSMNDNNTIIILKARCNKEYLENIIDKIQEHEDYGYCYDIEILEDILIEENIEHYIIYPISVNF